MEKDPRVRINKKVRKEGRQETWDDRKLEVDT